MKYTISAQLSEDRYSNARTIRAFMGAFETERRQLLRPEELIGKTFKVVAVDTGYGVNDQFASIELETTP